MNEKSKVLFAKIVLLIVCTFLAMIVVKTSHAQTLTAKSDTGITYGYGMGLNGVEELKMNVTYASNSTKLNRLQIDVHGGGGKAGSRHATGTVPLYKGNTTKYGDTYAYIDYPLGITSTKDSVKLAQYTADEMYRTLQSVYACCRFFAKPENSAKYHVDPNNIWISGVSWGAGAAFLSIHWQPKDYTSLVLDTMKWYNNSNFGYPFKIAGVIGISGFVFRITDIDTCDIPMIVLHGGKDALIKCDEGAVQKVNYVGGCGINYWSNQYENPIYFKYFPSGGHGLKVPNDPYQSVLNLSQARTFINSSVNSLRK